MYRHTTRRFGMISAALVALAVGAQADNRKPNLMDWQAIGDLHSVQIQSMQPITLNNVTEKANLRFGRRTWGIDLVWDKALPLNNVRFERKTGVGHIVYGEPIAIYIIGGGYLRYGKTRFGINLGVSATPSYEWRIAGGEEGAPVRPATPFALLNDVEHDAMIYGERPVGINLVWMKDFYKSTWDRVKGGIKGTAGLFADAFLGL